MSDPSSTLAGSSPAHPQISSAVSATVNGNPQAGPSSPPRTSHRDISMNGETLPKANGEGPADMSQLFVAKREEEMARRDRSLAEFLVMLDGYQPVVS